MSKKASAWDESSMVKTDSVSVNKAGAGLSVEGVSADSRFPFEVITGADVPGTTIRGDNVEPVVQVEAE